MPARRKLPDKATLRSLRNKGWRLEDIAEEYGVTTGGVWRALERAGYTENVPTYRDILPWKIEDRHKATAIMDRFRAIVRQRKGGQLSEAEARLLADWLRNLEERNIVVAYHPDAPPNAASKKGGFYYVPKEPFDEWIIRDPSIKPVSST